MQIVRQEPRLYGSERTRWRLADLAAAVPAFQGYTPAGVSRALRRLGVRLKRGRLRLHSPDPAYAAKVARLARARTLARHYPHRVVLIFGDEFGLYRQPTLAPAWWPGGEAPTVDLSLRANTRHRICGGLDVGSGRVVWRGGRTVGVRVVCRWLADLRATYPDRYLFLAWDNWPVHHHPRVLVTARELRIRLLWLPTYAPQTNPCEKLWRKLKQDLLHRHRLADDWPGLKTAVAAFRDRFGTDPAAGRALLRAVGEWVD